MELDYNSLPYHCMYALAKSPMPEGDVYANSSLDPASRQDQENHDLPHVRQEIESQ